MTPEERAEMEAAKEETQEETAAGKPAPTPADVSASLAGTHISDTPPAAAEPTTLPTTGSEANSSLAHHSSFSQGSPSASGSKSDLTKPEAGKDAKKTKPKITPEQKAKLDALEKKRDDEKEARCVESIVMRLITRIVALKDKLVQRIRPFVDAKNPGDINDTETKAFEGRIRVEAEDLKLESFGVEVS